MKKEAEDKLKKLKDEAMEKERQNSQIQLQQSNEQERYDKLVQEKKQLEMLLAQVCEMIP